MPPLKLSDFLAKEILRLHDQGFRPADIAAKLSLKKMQVASLVAHHAISKELVEPTTEEPFSDAAIRYEEPTSAEYVADKDTSDETITGIYVGDDREYDDPQLGCTPFVRQKVKTLPRLVEEVSCLRLDHC